MEKLLVKIYASLLILYGLANTFYLLAIFFFDTLAPPYMLPYLAWCDTAALVTGLALFKSPLNFVLGYGLLRCRPWARYGVFTGIATLPILILTELLWWGQYRLNTIAILSLLFSTSATLVLFARPAIKEMFVKTRPIRLVSATSMLAAGVALFAIVPVLCSVYVKLMFGKYADPPEIRQLTYKNPSSPTDGIVTVHLLDSSLPVFADSHVLNYDRIGFSQNPWRFTFTGPKGLIEYENHSVHENALDSFPFMEARGFELEKFFLTNRWNPLVITLRLIGRPQGSKYEVNEVQTCNARGFLTIHDDMVKKGSRRIFATFSLYEKNGSQCRRGMLISQVEPGTTADGILASFISSIRFLEPEKPDAAAIHFRQGTAYLKGERKLEGQVELANAYYLAPERKDFREAFESTLSKMSRELPHTWGDMKAGR